MIEFSTNESIERNFPLPKQMAFIPRVDLDSGATLTVQMKDGTVLVVLTSTTTVKKKSVSCHIARGKYDLILAGQTALPFFLTISDQ
jgi:hypothetical protein